MRLWRLSIMALCLIGGTGVPSFAQYIAQPGSYGYLHGTGSGQGYPVPMSYPSLSSSGRAYNNSGYFAPVVGNPLSTRNRPYYGAYGYGNYSNGSIDGYPPFQPTYRSRRAR